jgi:hypothetical protein
MFWKNKRLIGIGLALSSVLVALIGWVMDVYYDSNVLSWRTPGLGDIIPHAPTGSRSLRIHGQVYRGVLGERPGFITVDALDAVLFVQLLPGPSKDCKAIDLKSGKIVSFGAWPGILGFHIGRKSQSIKVIPLDENRFQIAVMEGRDDLFQFDMKTGTVEKIR